jgi:hypothetical protein
VRPRCEGSNPARQPSTKPPRTPFQNAPSSPHAHELAERPELSDSRPTATPADTTRSGTATPPRNGEAGRLFAPVILLGVRFIKSQSTRLPPPRPRRPTAERPKVPNSVTCRSWPRRPLPPNDQAERPPPDRDARRSQRPPNHPDRNNGKAGRRFAPAPLLGVQSLTLGVSSVNVRTSRDPPARARADARTRRSHPTSSSCSSLAWCEQKPTKKTKPAHALGRVVRSALACDVGISVAILCCWLAPSAHDWRLTTELSDSRRQERWSARGASESPPGLERRSGAAVRSSDLVSPQVSAKNSSSWSLHGVTQS